METEDYSTKVRSYYKTLAGDLTVARGKVLRALAEDGIPLSRAQLVDETGLSLQSICGRVNELLEMGLVVVVGEMFDSSTQRVVEALSIPDKIVKPIAITKHEDKRDIKALREVIEELADWQRRALEFIEHGVEVCSRQDGTYWEAVRHTLQEQGKEAQRKLGADND